MRLVNSTDTDLLPAGTIRFYEACIPPLQAGSYQLVAEQQVQSTSPAEQLARYTLPQPQPFTIYGPRFRLLPTDLQMVFPPAGQQGTYGESLPHVVLSRRDLPWSRAIDPVSPSTPPPNTPWLALLTVYAATEMSGETPLVSPPTRMTVSDVVSPPTGVCAPDLGSVQQGTITAGELAQSTLAFDVDAGLFAAIVPAQSELAYLSHAREVDTSAKETSGGVQDGFYSVVVGNRLPDSAPDASRDSFVFLVSLEGHWDHLPGGTGTGDARTVRLVVLASWQLTTSANAGDFLDILHALPQRGGVELLTMPAASAPAVTPEAAYAQEALDIGYVARLDGMRAGEQTTSWFRGPLAPYATAPDPYAPYSTSDAAIRYDPARGLLDRSYAVAWQIGRLLALADASFTQTVIAWRRQGEEVIAGRQNDLRLARRLRLAMPPRELARPRRSRQHNLLLRALAALLGPVARGELELPAVLPRRRRLDPGKLSGLAPQRALEEARRDGRHPLHAVLDDRLGDSK